MQLTSPARFGAIAISALSLVACATNFQSPNEKATMHTYKSQVSALLKSIETGDHAPVASINPTKYIQHNLGVGDGLAGFGAVMAQLPKGSAKARVVRVFQDGDFVFTQTEYDFFGPKIGFDVFRFEDGKIVEHWDNLQPTPATPNPSGRSMIDGPTTAQGSADTAANKVLARAFVEDLVNGRMENLAGHFDGDNYIQHNPQVPDTVSGLFGALKTMAQHGITMKYDRIHKVLGDGNFVLVLSEGALGGKHSAFYDLFRIEAGKIAEHWDVVEPIPPRDQWKNPNGKF